MKVKNIKIDGFIEQIWEEVKICFNNTCKETLKTRSQTKRKRMRNNTWKLVHQRKDVKLKTLNPQNPTKKMYFQKIRVQIKHLKEVVARYMLLFITSCRYKENKRHSLEATEKGNFKELYKIINKLKGYRHNIRPLKIKNTIYDNIYDNM